MTNGDAAPARFCTVPALKPGVNSGGHGLPFAFSVNVKLLSEDTVLPFQPVSSAWVVNVPHAFGAESGARRPLANSTCSLLNGNCGLSSNVVEICPVFGSITARPGSFSTTPFALATMYTAISELNGLSNGFAR